jgi:5-methylcytosine-specific restriction endonuclease McrA
LLRNLIANRGRENAATADLLADLAEVDARKLYLPAGYPSMHAYCVQELGFCEQAAFKRINAARAAREFPAIFPAVADGRLHLSAVVLLAAHLTPDNAEELLPAAARKSKAEIERLLAERFPRPDVPTRIRPLAPQTLTEDRLSPGKVGETCSTSGAPLALGGPAGASASRPRERRAQVTPLSPQRYDFQLTMSQELLDKLRYAQDLLGHRVSSGDVAQVLERALDALIAKLEQRQFGATERPRAGRRRSSGNRRYIPAQVRRAVRQRDGAQCTYVSGTGHRCTARRSLEFDHVIPVARGGEATVENLRLRCRAHNQHEAERTYGVEFMNGKRQAARAAAEERAEAEAKARAVAKEKAEEVIPWLQALGIRADRARAAAERCEAIPGASLEERIRVALQCFGARTPSRGGGAVTGASCGT